MRAARSLRDAVADGATNLEAREDMAVASVMGGLCLANAKLGNFSSSHSNVRDLIHRSDFYFLI